MKKLIIAFSLVTTVASTKEITKTGSEAKSLYKGIEKVLGEDCLGDTCSIKAVALSCSVMKFGGNFYICTVPSTQEIGKITTLMGGNAMDLFRVMNEFQPAVCESGICVAMFSEINCTKEGNWFPAYQCSVISAE